MTCAKCHGLKPEPGRLYGYAGNICYCDPPIDKILDQPMNCGSQVYTKDEVIHIANLQEKEAKIQLLDDVLKLMNTGMTIPMIRVRVWNMMVKVKGEGEKA